MRLFNSAHGLDEEPNKPMPGENCLLRSSAMRDARDTWSVLRWSKPKRGGVLMCANAVNTAVKEVRQTPWRLPGSMELAHLLRTTESLYRTPERNADGNPGAGFRS